MEWSVAKKVIKKGGTSKPHLLSVRLRKWREESGMTLDELAGRSKVSKAMLSKIENAKVQPTIALLGKLAEALDITITQLIGGQEKRRILHMKRTDQPVIFGNKEGYIRRSLSPIFPSRGVDFVEGTLKKGASTGSFGAHPEGVEEMLVLSRGKLRAILDGKELILEEGDSIYFHADVSHQFDNIGAKEAVFYLVINGSRVS